MMVSALLLLAAITLGTDDEAGRSQSRSPRGVPSRRWGRAWSRGWLTEQQLRELDDGAASVQQQTLRAPDARTDPNAHLDFITNLLEALALEDQPARAFPCRHSVQLYRWAQGAQGQYELDGDIQSRDWTWFGDYAGLPGNTNVVIAITRLPRMQKEEIERSCEGGFMRVVEGAVESIKQAGAMGVALGIAKQAVYTVSAWPTVSADGVDGVDHLEAWIRKHVKGLINKGALPACPTGPTGVSSMDVHVENLIRDSREVDGSGVRHKMTLGELRNLIGSTSGRPCEALWREIQHIRATGGTPELRGAQPMRCPITGRTGGCPMLRHALKTATRHPLLENSLDDKDEELNEGHGF